MDADVFEEVAQQPNAVFTIRFDNGRLSYLLQFVHWKCNKIPKYIYFIVFFCRPSVSPELRLVSQGATLSDRSQAPKSSDGSLSYGLDDIIVREVVSCNSEEMPILDKDQILPSRKRQKVTDDAKLVRFCGKFVCYNSVFWDWKYISESSVFYSLKLVESALARKPGGDRIVKEYNRTNGLTDSTRRKMVKIIVADMTEIHG